MMTPEQLVTLAEQEIAEVWKKLPPPLLASAQECPVRILLKPTDKQREEMGQEADDLLGLFEGSSRLENLASAEQMPSISLFIEAIWEEAEEDMDIYREEVKVTYLHELGHYLGWDEDEVESRGL
ncbi:MAG: metallopeptidase family protein [Blastochloris sp.]|nr:metallopeptidase family protein [Blastochloris sp.]